jgi:hypothetical protein
MGTIWTPSGERPIGRADEPSERATETPTSGIPTNTAGAPSDEQLAAEMAEAQRQLLEAPVSVVIANHCIGLFQLAALHLNRPEPDLQQASLAIDALAAIVETLGDRLAEDESTLRDALAQLRLAFVHLRSEPAGSPPPPPTDPDPRA